MTIHNHINNFEVECDLCGTSEDFDKDINIKFSVNNVFSEMIQSLKDDGWKIYKSEIFDEWNHLCPSCNNRDVEE